MTRHDVIRVLSEMEHTMSDGYYYHLSTGGKGDPAMEETLDALYSATQIICGDGYQMTLEELKAEAKRQGYRLVKEQPYIKLAECPKCGRKPSLWHTMGEHLLECNNCSIRAEPNKSERQARINWNALVGEVQSNGKTAD